MRLRKMATTLPLYQPLLLLCDAPKVTAYPISDISAQLLSYLVLNKWLFLCAIAGARLLDHWLGHRRFQRIADRKEAVQLLGAMWSARNYLPMIPTILLQFTH